MDNEKFVEVPDFGMKMSTDEEQAFLQYLDKITDGAVLEEEKRKQFKDIIMDLIADNKENMHYALNEYDRAYTDGYHDALVDLMNKLCIEHNEEIINQ